MPKEGLTLILLIGLAFIALFNAQQSAFTEKSLICVAEKNCAPPFVLES